MSVTVDGSTTEPYIVFGEPEILQPEIDEVVACLKSGWLGTGPRVAKLEADFAAYKGVTRTHTAAVNSCTAALHVSMVAAGLDKGAEVITTPLTFCATINAIIHAGLTPVLADVDPQTQCISPDSIEAAITSRTQAILPVHFAGRPCEMDRIMSIAEKHGLVVIEDCAHAIETEFQGRKAGTFGDFGCFSFYVTKNIVTGEGGMILGRKEELIARAKVLALHGMSKDAWHRFGDKGYKHYQVTESGFKYNMMDLQAAIGIHQLERIESNWEKRRGIWAHYQDAFAGLPIGLPKEPAPQTRHAYHLFTISVNAENCGVERDQFLDLLDGSGVGTGVHYLAIPEHPFYRETFGWQPEEFPAALAIGRATVSLPMSPKLNSNDIDRVVSATKRAIGF